MAPSKPKTAATAAAETQYQTWNEFVADATEGLKPYGLVLPGDAEPTLFPCPTGDQMEAFGVASRSMDDNAAAVALFGDNAPAVLKLTGAEPFIIRARLFQKIMEHYGIQLGALPQS